MAAFAVKLNDAVRWHHYYWSIDHVSFFNSFLFLGRKIIGGEMVPIRGVGSSQGASRVAIHGQI